MKFRKIFDGLIILSLFSVVGYIGYNRYIKKPVIKQSFSQIKKANDILKYKSIVPEQVINTSLTSAVCTVFLKNSAEKSMMDYINQFLDHHADKIVETCKGAFPSALQTKIEEALAKCKDSTLDKISNECFAALLTTKTASVAAIIKPEADPRDLDASILLNLVADKFSSGDFLEHPHKALELVNALLDKEPSYLGGYKLKLMLLSMSSLSKDEYYRTDFEETIQEARRLNAKDPEILELELAQKGHIFSPNETDGPNDKRAFIQYLDAEAKKYPNEWIYDYYQAQAIYNSGKGDYERTLGLLQSALLKAPNDSRLKQTIENLKSDDEDKRKHPFIISVGFSLNDL